MATIFPVYSAYATGDVLTAAQMSGQATAINTLAKITPRTVAGVTDTLVIGDQDSALVMYSSTSAVAVTIPTVATAGWMTGAVVNVLKTGSGTNAIAFTGAVGVTITSAATVPAVPTITAQYKLATFIMTTANNWVCIGGIA
jgi:hypothetical protein